MTRIALITGGNRGLGKASTLTLAADELTGALQEHWGRDTFDILINNAGFDGRTPFGHTDAATIDALHAAHVKGPILLTELLAPMIDDGGRVPFISTGLTRYVANPVYSVYASMKGAPEQAALAAYGR